MLNVYDTCFTSAFKYRLTHKESRLVFGIRFQKRFFFHCYCLIGINGFITTVDYVARSHRSAWFFYTPFRSERRYLKGDIYRQFTNQVRIII